MRPVRLALLALLICLPGPVLAQSHDHDAAAADASPAQAAFDRLKTLAGSWVGRLDLPADPTMDGRFAQFSMRVASIGNSFVHELSLSGRPDHPITMFHLDGDRLMLTHYCDAGNRPRMVGKVSPDGTRVEFEFLDVSGPLEYGHMYGAAFTFIDEDNHVQEWTWMMPSGDKVPVRFELQRTNFESAASY